MTTAASDQQAVEEFVGRALTDIAGTMATLFCIVGDKLGLFAALADAGGRAELAERAATSVALEWAAAWYPPATSSSRATASSSRPPTRPSWRTRAE